METATPQYNIFDLGFDKFLSKQSDVFGALTQAETGLASVLGNVISGGTNPSDLTSGEWVGNISIKDGYLRSANYVSGSAGWILNYDGSVEIKDLTLFGGIIKYQKTSFTDSTNAGYFISSSGIYFGAAADATKFKFTIATGALEIGGVKITGLATGSSIDGQYLSALSVQTGSLALLSVTAAQIAANTITAGQITNNTITATQITNNTITATQIANNTITATQIANNTITASQITNATITATQIANATITATQIGTALYNQIDANLPSDIGLVGYWSLDEGSGATAYDNSVSANNGTISGATFAQGIVGTALNFTGSGSRVVTTGTISTTTTISVSLWVKWDSLDLIDTLYLLGSQSGTIGYHWFYYNSNTLNWQYANGTNPITKSKAFTPSLGQWYHIVATHNYTTKEVILYVDGVSLGITTHTDDVVAVTSKTSALGGYALTSHNINGLLDEVRVYTNILTAKEIYALYTNPAGIRGRLIPGSQIQGASITAVQISNATITSAQISGTAGITGAQIAAATIAGSNIALTTIAAANIVASTITAGQIANLTITASQIANLTITSGKVNTALMSYNHNLVFSASSATVVAWATGTITMSDGTSYTIAAGNTGTMSAKTFVYLAPATSTTVLQTTTTLGTAVGDGKMLIAVAQNNTTECIFQVFNGIGGLNLAGTSIVTGSITANEIAAATITTTQIAANTIVAGNIAASTITGTQIAASTITSGLISVSSLSALSANLGTITAGTITLDTAGYIRGGQTAYNTGTGFFLGYSTDAYKFSIGNPATQSLTWDNLKLKIKGDLFIDTLQWNRNTIISAFESLDGWEKGGIGTEVITCVLGGTKLETGATNNDTAYISCVPANGFGDNPNFDKNPLTQVRLKVMDYDFAEVHIHIGKNGFQAALSSYAGFKLDQQHIYAVSRKSGSAENTTDVGITPNTMDPNTYKVLVTSGSKIEFYVNGTLVATHTTNLPTSNNETSCMFIGVKNALNGGQQTIGVYHALYQEDY